MKPLFASIVILALSGCVASTPVKDFHERPLSKRTAIDEQTAILLVGVKGPLAVNYIQLCSRSTNCLNYKGIYVNNDVIALPVPLPLNGVELNSYTVSSQRSGYSGSQAYGYIGVDDERITVNEKGVYYLLTIDTSEKGAFELVPSEAQLMTAKKKYASLVPSLKPLNFEWK